MVNACPFCGAALQRGYVGLQSGCLSSGLFGWSELILTFTASDTYEYDVLEAGDRRVAYGCPQCHAVVATTEPWIA